MVFQVAQGLQVLMANLENQDRRDLRALRAHLAQWGLRVSRDPLETRAPPVSQEVMVIQAVLDQWELRANWAFKVLLVAMAHWVLLDLLDLPGLLEHQDSKVK